MRVHSIKSFYLRARVKAFLLAASAIGYMVLRLFVDAN